MKSNFKRFFLSLFGFLPVTAISMNAESKIITSESNFGGQEVLLPSVYSTDQISAEDRNLLRSIVPPFQGQATFNEMYNRLSEANPNLSDSELRYAMIETVLILKRRGIMEVGLEGGDGPTSR